MKSIALFFIIANVATGYNSCHEKRTFIVWDEYRKLKISDFKGEVKKRSWYGGASTIKMKFTYTVDITLKKSHAVCVFSKEESWLLDTSAYAIKHEQKHFDVGEIATRLFRKNILDIRPIINRANYKILDSIYRSYGEVMAKLELEYDSATNHGLDTINQKHWDLKIRNELDSLRNYASPTFK